MQIGSTSRPIGEAMHRACRPAIHGATRYKSGCRCDQCRAAHAASILRYVERRRARGLPTGPTVETRAKSRAKERANYSYTEEKRQRDAVRRARKAGATIERFLNVEIFERDAWICGICDLPVDREASWPDPNMPSLDHIQPLSLGGDHSRANTRCAHLGCNVRRGNRVDAKGVA